MVGDGIDKRIRGGAAVLALVLLLSLVGPSHFASGDPAPQATPAAAEPPYRIGYASADIPTLARVNVNDNSSEQGPDTGFPADEASDRNGDVAFVTHRSGQVDSDLEYLPAGAGTPIALLHDGFSDHHPALSPDGRTIAFDSDRSGQLDIWLIGVNGTGLRQLTAVPADDIEPTWSPDGRTIAFSSTRDDPAGDIYTIPAVGGAVTRLTNSPAADTEPSWSSANIIAFTTTQFDPNTKTIALVPAGGGTPTRLIAGDQPAWAPGTSTLAYVSRAKDPSGDIATTTVNGRTAGPVTVLADNPNQAETHPTWDTTSTVEYTSVIENDFFSDSEGVTDDVWSADATGQDRLDHTNVPDAEENGPAFSADGQHLAYTQFSSSSGDISSSRITVADADGRNPHALTAFSSNRFDSDPAWSPDGTRIALARDIGDTSTVIVVQVSDGQVLAQIPAPYGISAHDQQPTWSPDSTHISFARASLPLTPSPVTPGAVDRRANPGGNVNNSFTVDQSIPTPNLPPNPDVVLLVDTTASMGGAIADVRKNLSAVIDDITKAQPTAQFAVASFGDVTDPDPRLFEVRQDLTANKALLQQAVNGLDASGGDDPDEDWGNGLFQVANGGKSTNIHYRSGSTPVVVLVSDAATHDPSAGVPLTNSIAALNKIQARVVAVAVGSIKPGTGIDGKGQATRVVTATGGQLVQATTSGDVSKAILTGLHSLPVTVTPSVQSCDTGLTVTFIPPTPVTVTGGLPATFGQVATVATGVAPGTTLHCVILYSLSTGAVYPVPLTVEVNDPQLPLVNVDNQVVRATTPDGAVVPYLVTAFDSSNNPLTATCLPPSGSQFPIGETVVTCSATDLRGTKPDGTPLTGTDTGRISVFDPEAEGFRIWVATVDFTADPPTVPVQVDISAHVTGACPARLSDLAPAWSPDGKSIAFSANGSLCLVDPTGANAKVLINEGESSSRIDDPAWSPAGTLIAFTLSNGEFEGPQSSEIDTIPADGGDPTPVVTSPSVDPSPPVGGDNAIPTTVVASQGVPFEPAFWPLSSGLTLTATAAPQPVGVGTGTVTVTYTAQNTAKLPSARTWIATDAPAVAPAATLIGTLAPGASATVTVSVPETAAVNGISHGVVTGSFPGDLTAVARAQVPVVITQRPPPPPNPLLTTNPGIGPPGFVTIVKGTQFPPGVTVTLKWSLGITAPTRVVVRPDGTFQVQMLIFYHDQLGPRQVVATGTGFTPVTAPFLVVPGSQEPRDFVERR